MTRLMGESARTATKRYEDVADSPCGPPSNMHSVWNLLLTYVSDERIKL